MDIIRGSLSIITVVVLFGATQAGAHSIAAMEKIASRAPTLSALLENKFLLEKYRKAVIAYYGVRRFHCQSFTETISDLRRLVRKVPHISNALWKHKKEKNSLLVMTDKGDVFQFRSLPRKIHALWAYQGQDRCEDDVCNNLFKEGKSGAKVFLGRWSIALEGSQVHLIEKNLKYSKMAVLLTPQMQAEKRVGVVEMFGDAAAFNTQIPLRPSLTSAAKKRSLFEVWLAKLKQVQPLWATNYFVSVPGKKMAFRSGGWKIPDAGARKLASVVADRCEKTSLSLDTYVPVVFDASAASFAPINMQAVEPFGIGGDLSFDDFTGSNLGELAVQNELPTKQNFQGSTANTPRVNQAVLPKISFDNPFAGVKKSKKKKSKIFSPLLSAASSKTPFSLPKTPQNVAVPGSVPRALNRQPASTPPGVGSSAPAGESGVPFQPVNDADGDPVPFVPESPASRTPSATDRDEVLQLANEIRRRLDEQEPVPAEMLGQFAEGVALRGKAEREAGKELLTRSQFENVSRDEQAAFLSKPLESFEGKKFQKQLSKNIWMSAVADCDEKVKDEK